VERTGIFGCSKILLGKAGCFCVPGMLEKPIFLHLFQTKQPGPEVTVLKIHDNLVESPTLSSSYLGAESDSGNNVLFLKLPLLFICLQ
jgi:hypothetical protein